MCVWFPPSLSCKVIKADLVAMNFGCIAVVRCSSKAIPPVKNTITEIQKKTYSMLGSYVNGGTNKALHADKALNLLVARSCGVS
ncbi:hypothetical protein QOZ98_000398 [Planomicrobium stackebrandtii]|uniref:Uncharacterized protein n=1 Tax=Planomicrobium stackebrandtii TaxID=253160 RepID=A0ABU0GQL0_9BACL|nr:hypothetical protein [Planomicrobium stackebrandtii]